VHSYPELREEQGANAADARVADEEAGAFKRQLQEEELGQARQDREERKLYAGRIFLLVAIWLGVVVLLLFAQGFLGPRERFSLADSVLIATATTTTASVTALLVVVARYLFPRGNRRTRPSGTGRSPTESTSRPPPDSRTR